MDENTNKALFNLMQKVVDKLDDITEKLTHKELPETDDIVSNETLELKELITTTIKNQTLLNKSNLEIEARIIKSILNNKTTPSVNNYSEYSLLGSKSHFKPKILVFLLFFLVIIWSSFKYLPPYLNEKSTLKKEKEDYELFYNYVYLSQFKNSKATSADTFLKRIQENDSILINDYNSLLKTYRDDIKRQDLERELKSLNKNDR